METQVLQAISQAVAPIVMVSAAGLLFMGLQAKNLHLADRVRALVAEHRALRPGAPDEERRLQIVEQLAVFKRRVHLSQRALELLYLAIVCFVLTSLLLAAAPWVGSFAVAALPTAIFIAGVGLLLLALLLEYREMQLGLRTIDIEVEGIVRSQRGG